MKRGTFSVIVVPHDLKKTRTYRVPYRLFYVLVTLLGITAVVLIVFVATYGRLLIKTRETVMLERQVDELSRRNERIGELTRNLARLHEMDGRIRGMLGMDTKDGDTVASAGVALSDDRGFDEEREQVLMATPTFWPVKGYITKGYSVKGGEGSRQYHRGIDIAVERGTPVKASANGEVSDAGWDDTYGYYVVLDHGYGIKTLYGHNERLVVMKGERVGRGQTIAFSGNTGRSTAPHLHFEVSRNNIAVDPLKYLLK